MPQAGPPSSPASLWGDLEWQRVSAFQDNEAKPTQWALVVVLNVVPFSFGPGPRQWNILESHTVLTELAGHPMGHFKSTDFTVDILSDLHS